MIENSIKRKLLQLIVGRNDYLGKYKAYDGLMAFLSKIWPLRDLPAKRDDRYTNQYDNIFQHRINNADWDDEELYESQLDLVNGDPKYFTLFLETVVSPQTRTSREDILAWVPFINNELPGNEQLYLADYFEGLPVFKLGNRELVKDLPQDIKVNSIPFFRDNADVDTYPCFFLAHDAWNDFGYVTQMNLVFYRTAEHYEDFGRVKIMRRGTVRTWDTLDKKFTSLPEEYCSLGQSPNYYYRLKANFASDYQSILMALRDVAFFPRILDVFENDLIFKTSLLRENVAEKTLRVIRFELSGSGTLDDCYRFSYNHTPPYSDTNTVVHFDFKTETVLEHRIYAMIGKNGAGKTSILSALAKQMEAQNPELLSPRKPLFSKFFTVSYSFFDAFAIPEGNAAFNYIYCGLKKRDGSVLTVEEQSVELVSCAEKIGGKGLLKEWHTMLKDVIPAKELLMIFNLEPEHPSQVVGVNIEELVRLRRQFSSGESILLFVLTKIISEIRFDSLIMYDEPETHLHPNAISSLMNTLFLLVKKFRSFCIIATHSPLVIQEIHARNIIILKREDKELKVEKMPRDSFGENLTVISEDIFNNKDVSKHHLSVIANLVEKGKTFDEIVEIFKYDNLPVNINTRLYIKSIIAEKNG